MPRRYTPTLNAPIHIRETAVAAFYRENNDSADFPSQTLEPRSARLSAKSALGVFERCGVR